MSSAIYTGIVTHVRWKPFVHRLRFGLFSLLLDLDEVDRLTSRIPFFSRNRFNLVSFYDRDFGPRDGSDLRSWLIQQMTQAGMDETPGRIRLLSLPRVLGYQFNPLTVWFVDDRAGTLRWILYEIHNTFGESHAHLVEVAGSDRLDHGFAKELFVSPFFDVEGRYRVRIRRPADTLAIVIDYETDGTRALTATLRGARRRLTGPALLRSVAAYPLVTFKVIAGIHWEAAKLWAKGATYRRRPQPPAETMSTTLRKAA
jgi:uncharacterized protein